VGNPLRAGMTAAQIPGAGAGLVGLAERVELEGGLLERGSANGVFTLTGNVVFGTGAIVLLIIAARRLRLSPRPS
jgi:hypothetical protein